MSSGNVRGEEWSRVVVFVIQEGSGCMLDEKDLEIARLKGQLEVAGRRPSVAVGTLNVVGTLVALAAAIIAVLAWFGSQPGVGPRTPSERLAIWEQQIAGACDLKWTKTEEARSACVVRERQTRPLPPA